MRSEGYGSWVCLFVCPCFNSPLNCLFVPQTIRSTARVMTTSLIEPFFSEYAPLQRSQRCQHSTHTNSRPFSENTHAHYFYHVCKCVNLANMCSEVREKHKIRASETSVQILQQDRKHKASMRANETSELP